MRAVHRMRRKYFSQTHQSQLVLTAEMINSLVLVKPWISSGSLIYSCPWYRLDGDWHICSQPIWLPGHHSNRAVLPACTLPGNVLPHRKCPANPNPWPHTELCQPTKDHSQPISSPKLFPLTQEEQKTIFFFQNVSSMTNFWNRIHCLKTSEQKNPRELSSYPHLGFFRPAFLSQTKKNYPSFT